MKNRKLFIVEFGKPCADSLYSYNSIPPLFVLAESYDEAAEKALRHAESKSQGVVGLDGSLNITEELKVKSVKLASDELVW